MPAADGTSAPPRGRLRQVDRRARSRAALLEATARGLSRVGYAHLVLEEVAADAGYSRGALYHQFRDKDELVLATIAWVNATWFEEVGAAFDDSLPPLAVLCEIARRHAIYCRRGNARLMVALRMEFGERDHPIGDAVRAAMTDLVERVRRLVIAGRRDGSIPRGPSATTLAAAWLSAVEAAVIAVAGRYGEDAEIAERVARGIRTAGGR
jgi:AcrR family transcriptional regulator